MNHGKLNFLRRNSIAFTEYDVIHVKLLESRFTQRRYFSLREIAPTLGYVVLYCRNSIVEFIEKHVLTEKPLITILFQHVEFLRGLEESFSYPYRIQKTT